MIRRILEKLGLLSKRGPEGGDDATPDAERRGIKIGIRRTILVLLTLGVIGGGLLFVSGIASIKASSRHWAVTAWFLNTGMARSVSTHSLGIEAPSLDDPNLMLKGAGHYEIGCRPCHGGPDLFQPRISYMMTPHPPWLPEKVREWTKEELFYIVKHGVKFTGMPAWPAQQRDDEVWAMVAFLQTLPTLDGVEYRRLTTGEPRSAPPMEAMEGADQSTRFALQSCARCHGYDGVGRGSGAFPKLAGQSAEYMQNALDAYARGDRHSGIMYPIAFALDPTSTQQIARYYAALERPPAEAVMTDAAAIERGREIAHHGIPAQKVASCVDCHAPGGERHKPAYPSLNGQHADYLVLQLELFKSGQRGGSAYAHLMHAVAPRLKPEQMRDVARFFQSER